MTRLVGANVCIRASNLRRTWGRCKARPGGQFESRIVDWLGVLLSVLSLTDTHSHTRTLSLLFVFLSVSGLRKCGTVDVFNSQSWRPAHLVKYELNRMWYESPCWKWKDWKWWNEEEIKTSQCLSFTRRKKSCLNRQEKSEKRERKKRTELNSRRRFKFTATATANATARLQLISVDEN